MQWLNRDSVDYLIFNPNLFAQIASLNYIRVNFWWIEWIVKFNVVAEKFTPFDYEALWNLDNM